MFWLELLRDTTMPKRSKLLQALDEHKGRDYDAEKQKKLVKAAEKRKRAKTEEEDEEEEKVDKEKDTEMKVRAGSSALL